jgi:hypothetical protein
MTDKRGPLAKMLHDAFWERASDSLTWQDEPTEEKDRWRNVAALVALSTIEPVETAPPPQSPADLELRKWAIGAVLNPAIPGATRATIAADVEFLIALALGQPVADRLKP